MRAADRQCHHFLQRRHPVAAAHQIRGERHTKALAMIKSISPAAWRHGHLNGHDTFRSAGQSIDLNAIMAGLNLG
jgi:hypothetical protein